MGYGPGGITNQPSYSDPAAGYGSIAQSNYAPYIPGPGNGSYGNGGQNTPQASQHSYSGDNGMGISYQQSGLDGQVDQANLSYNGMSVPLKNPGMMDPNSINPYASQYLQNNQDLMAQVHNSVLSPSQYGQLQNTQQANLTTSMDNQYARMGLSGSSAEMGGVAQAINQNSMNWMNRQQSDMSNYAHMYSSLNQQGYGDVMGLQNQYGNFQDVYGQDMFSLMGINQQDNASNNQMWGNIISSGLSAVGSIAGGSGGKSAGSTGAGAAAMA